MIQIDKPMPDGCDACPLMYDYIQCNALPEGCEDDDAFNEEGFDWTKRPKWCPLKEQEAVVRCKDCKYYHKPEYGFTYGDCTYCSAWLQVSTDDFCSKGRRKDT